MLKSAGNFTKREQRFLKKTVTALLFFAGSMQLLIGFLKVSSNPIFSLENIGSKTLNSVAENPESGPVRSFKKMLRNSAVEIVNNFYRGTPDQIYPKHFFKLLEF